MKRKLIWIWAIVATLWAIGATGMHIRNPLPFPDRGHRAYGVPDEKARQTVVNILQEVTPLRERFTFDSGATHQTLMWDNMTVIHYLDSDIQKARSVSGNGLSVAVDDPMTSAKRAVELLKAQGYQAEILTGINYDLPEGYLVPVTSNAFNDWALVFRRPLIKMPYPNVRK